MLICMIYIGVGPGGISSKLGNTSKEANCNLYLSIAISTQLSLGEIFYLVLRKLTQGREGSCYLFVVVDNSNMVTHLISSKVDHIRALTFFYYVWKYYCFLHPPSSPAMNMRCYFVFMCYCNEVELFVKHGAC